MAEEYGNGKIGEIIEACTTDFVAQCYELYQSPSLGCLVKTRGDNPTGQPENGTQIYGIVSKVLTTGMEPGRRPIARGKGELNEDEIYRSSPQLYKLLKSEFNVLVVGYGNGARVFQHLPPRPARIHSFVHLCEADEIKQFSQSFDFLNILLKARMDIGVEELVGASLREISRVYGGQRHAFLVGAGKELATLLSRDYNQLKAILKGLKYDAIE
jgi:hypothetical protein